MQGSRVGSDEGKLGRRAPRSVFLKPRVLVSLAVAAVASLLTIVLWAQLVADRSQDIADVAETVSYATRSELVRRLETQFSALRRVALFWAAYGGAASSAIPRLASDARIELDHFDGVEFVAWRYPNRSLRFFTQAQTLDLTRQPTDEEWARVERALESVGDPDQEALIGPDMDEQGHLRYLLYVPVSLNGDRAALISSVEVRKNLGAILRDAAPGYAIRVRCCDGIELFSRGEPAPNLEDDWRRDGWIELSPGALWNVEHAPTQTLLEDLQPAVLDAVLVSGLLMSLLLGAFVHETLRARSRARAATAARRQLATANEALDLEVQDRTRGLTEALTDINTINLSVSHDLRSPLQSIVSLTQLLEVENKEQLGPKARERLCKILANTRYMSGFMDRLLSFSQASSLDYETRTLDMRELAEQVAADLAKNEPKYPHVTVGDLPPCSADETMVRILLTNLIENALKYANGDSGEAHVDVGHTMGDGATIYYVKDNGPGFAQSEADRLFEPLERVETSGHVAGLGLGLAIVKRIVSRHGGRVWAESAVGEGATFFFTLHGER